LASHHQIQKYRCVVKKLNQKKNQKSWIETDNHGFNQRKKSITNTLQHKLAAFCVASQPQLIERGAHTHTLIVI